SSTNIDPSSPPNAIGILSSNPTLQLVATTVKATRRPRNGQSLHPLGFISRNVLTGQSSDAAIDAASGLATATNLFHSSDLERAVDPGDRYPTTSLSTPSTLLLEDVHSFFSDDDESNCSTTTNR